MLFSSIVFLFYFLPAVIGLYYLFFWSKTIQNILLLGASLLFYAWGEPKYVLLMIGSIMMNYCFGLLMGCFTGFKKSKQILLWTSVLANLAILFLFKYLNFVITSINQNLPQAHQLPMSKLALPIGISFFTFQAMSYVIDVYRNTAKVQKNPFYLGLYISFFPQLVAGPIVRYTKIEDQMKNRKESLEKFSAGACRFITGLAKKILISNQMAVIADRIFLMQELKDIPMMLAWLGIICYALQILYDFSGYSDMAIGLGLMFGFKFDENFNYPYISTSVSEFWRRWHISLGAWFRDYVYIPLGGSRVKNQDRVIFNLLIVWLLTGIWHGAEWTFIFWGLFHFILIALERITRFEQKNIPAGIKWFYTMFSVLIGWVLFRSEDVVHAGRYIANLFGFGQAGIFSPYVTMFIRENAVFLAAGILFCIPVAKRTNQYLYERKKGTLVFDFIYPFAMIGLLFICICYLMKGTYNPFIYFNF